MVAFWSLSRGRIRSGRRAARGGPNPAEAAAPTQTLIQTLTQALAATERDRDRLANEATARTAFLLALLRDLRGPLHTLSGFAQLLEINAGSDPLSPRQAQAAREMVRAAAELTGRMDEAAAFSDAHRPSPPAAPRRIDLRLAARLACDGLHSRALAAGVALDCGPPTAGLCAQADPQRVQAALRALIDDALRHAAPGDIVRLDVERRDDRIELTRTTRTPPGRPRSLIDAVDAEGRLRPGLGLGAVQRLAESMGGDLKPVRAVQGSALRLSLPAADAATPRPRIRLALYAGSEPAEIALLRHAAGRMDFSLQVAETPEAALSLVQALRPDVVLVDAAPAPGAARRLRRRMADDPATVLVPVVALTEAGAPAPASAPLAAAGFDALLTRPLDLEALAETLAALSSRASQAERALDAEAAREA